MSLSARRFSCAHAVLHVCESIPSVWSHEVDSCGLSTRRGPETKLKSTEMWCNEQALTASLVTLW